MLRTLITIWSIVAISFPAYGTEDLKPVHPDESPDYTYNERFSSKSSLESLSIIKSALDSFKRLTEASSGKIPKKTMAKIGNTDWEMQNLGFTNHVGTVKGTILKQEYLIKKLTYELAQKKAKSGEISQAELSTIKTDYEKAEKQFRYFWKSFHIED